MSATEIIIGRDASCDYVIPKRSDEVCKVSRKHARLLRTDTGLVLEDLGSSNGTFVNGKRIKRCAVGTSDRITLGSPSGERIELSQLIKELPVSDAEYRQKVEELGEYYREYQDEVSRLQNKMQSDIMMKRMGPPTMLGVLISLFTAFADDKLPIIIIGGLATVAVFFLANRWAISSAKAIKKRLIELNEDFDLRFSCPACGASWKGHTFKWYAQQGRCHACKRQF